MKLLSALLLLTTLILAGCGFHLRAPPHYAFNSIYLDGHPNAAFERDLKNELERIEGMSIKTNAHEAQVILHMGNLVQERTILSLSSTGLVSQFTLNMRLDFRADDDQGNELLEPTSAAISHVFNYNAGEPLAKSQEETLLYDSMRSELLQTMLRRLGAIKPLTKTSP
jgi:LPS-assembly lipoprotein